MGGGKREGSVLLGWCFGKTSCFGAEACSLLACMSVSNREGIFSTVEDASTSCTTLVFSLCAETGEETEEKEENNIKQTRQAFRQSFFNLHQAIR